MNKILRFLLKPLVDFLEDDEGERIYQYLYFNRNSVESEVESAIVHGHHNITVVGKPGMGKTSLVHYMFIQLKKHTHLYPIILDYRNITPQKPEALLTLFVKEARKYFSEIKQPITQITEETTLKNCEDHSLIVQMHLHRCLKSSLNKKMVIFLDDLDYAENDYMTILNNYFLPYAQTDKVNMILSVRPPLLNNLRKNDRLRQYYQNHPRIIEIPDDDIELILNNRLKTVLELEENEAENKTLLQIVKRKFINVLRERTVDEIIIKKLREEDNSFNSETLRLPFESTFYPKMKNITFSNLRMIEELIPDILDWERAHPDNSINNNFYEVFITIGIKKSHIVLDLVSDKTRDRKKKLNGNSILQNVLEYFYFEDTVRDHFYKEMEQFGVTRTEADEAIEQLVRTPHSLIVPEYVYLPDTPVHSVIKRYKINKKGIQYIQNILRNPLYYSLENDEQVQYKKSSRSYYDEKLNTGTRPNNC
jgi:energy-coupling factor transporter ATP-binding protein EcfA2